MSDLEKQLFPEQKGLGLHELLPQVKEQLEEIAGLVVQNKKGNLEKDEEKKLQRRLRRYEVYIEAIATLVKEKTDE